MRLSSLRIIRLIYFRILFRLRRFDEWVVLILPTQKSEYRQSFPTFMLPNCASFSKLDEVLLGRKSLRFLSHDGLVLSRVTPGKVSEWLFLGLLSLVSLPVWVSLMLLTSSRVTPGGGCLGPIMPLAPRRERSQPGARPWE